MKAPTIRQYPPCPLNTWTESPRRVKGGRQTAILSYRRCKSDGEDKLWYEMRGFIWPYGDFPTLELIDAAISEARIIGEQFDLIGSFSFQTPAGVLMRFQIVPPGH